MATEKPRQFFLVVVLVIGFYGIGWFAGNRIGRGGELVVGASDGRLPAMLCSVVRLADHLTVTFPFLENTSGPSTIDRNGLTSDVARPVGS
jgi:hypothetical protein